MKEQGVRAIIAVFVVAAACGAEPAATGPVLSRIVDEAAGANCRDGGRAVQSGIDRDDDGALGEAEVETTVYICRRDRLRLVAEAPGPHCATGGTAVWVGDDANENDVLEQGEVRDVAYVCATMHALLTRVVLAAPSAPCTEGAAIDAGLDLDDDGALGDHEVAITEYVCGRALVGNVSIQTPADLVRFQGVRGVVNSIAIAAGALEAIELPNLAFVGGAFIVTNNPKLTAMSHPQLTRVGEAYLVQNNAALAAVATPAIIGGPVIVRNNGALTDLDVDNTSVGGPITIENNAVLATIDWSSVATRDAIEIRENPALTTISMAGIAGTTRLVVERNALLDALAVSGSLMRGDVVVADHPVLDSANLGFFEFSGDVTIANNATMTAVGFGAATRVRGNLTITGSPIVTVGGPTLDIDGDAELANLQLQALTPANFEIVRGALSLHDNPALVEVDALRVGGRVSVVDNPVLATASFHYAESHHAAEIAVSSNATLAQFTALELASAGAIAIDANPALTAAGFPVLLSAESIAITNNASLPVCQITALFERIASPNETQSGNDDDGVCAP